MRLREGGARSIRRGARFEPGAQGIPLSLFKAQENTKLEQHLLRPNSFVQDSPAPNNSTQPLTMTHLSNPLVTTTQLYDSITSNALPLELQDSIRFYTARLTQAAGLLLRLPQSITAQANVLLFRYWMVDDLMRFEFAVCASLSFL